VLDDARDQVAAEVLFELLPERRRRVNPRVVKRKMSNFGVKRPEHRNWPAAAHAVRVLDRRAVEA
jgi:hypothetical protein